MWKSKPFIPVVSKTDITYMTALNTTISVKRGDIFPHEDYLKIQELRRTDKEKKQLQDDIDGKQKIIDEFNYHACSLLTPSFATILQNMSQDAKTALVEKFRKDGYNALIVENKFTVL